MKHQLKLLTFLFLIPLLCGCSQALDLAMGDWYGTEEMYLLDDERDPITYTANMHLLLGDHWDYVLEITFNGIADREEFADFHDITYSGTWSRIKAKFEFSDFGRVQMIHFTDENEMTLAAKWGFDGRNASELKLSEEERLKIKDLPTFTLHKKQ